MASIIESTHAWYGCQKRGQCGVDTDMMGAESGADNDAAKGGTDCWFTASGPRMHVCDMARFSWTGKQEILSVLLFTSEGRRVCQSTIASIM